MKKHIQITPLPFKIKLKSTSDVNVTFPCVYRLMLVLSLFCPLQRALIGAQPPITAPLLEVTKANK